MTLSLANSVEEVEPGGSGCNTQSDSDSESSNSFRFTDVKDVKLMTGAPATTTSVVFKDSPYATVGDTINIHIVKANINGKEFEKYTNHNIDIPCESNEPASPPKPPPSTFHLRLRYILVPSILTSILILFATLFIFIKDVVYTKSLSFLPINSHTTTYIAGHPVYFKANWGGVEDLQSPLPNGLPSSLVVISHTATESCVNFTNCAICVQKFEADSFKMGRKDIGYNFLIGGDGGIYVGLGWEGQNNVRKDSIAIAFIGDFNKEFLNESARSAGQALIAHGVDQGKVDDGYKLIGENQTSPLRYYSPGWNLATAIKNWRHYFSGTMLYQVLRIFSSPFDPLSPFPSSSSWTSSTLEPLTSLPATSMTNSRYLSQVTGPQAIKTNGKEAKNGLEYLKHLLAQRSTHIFLFGIILSITIVTSLIMFFYFYNFKKVTEISNTFGHDDNLGDGIQVIHREEWLARPPLNSTKINHPLSIVRIMHTGGNYCKDYQTCAGSVLALQGWQVGTQGMPDISYNYLIGGDGNVYVGRGAGVENEWMIKAIDVVYIGNFLAPYDKLTDKMDLAGRRLIDRLRNEGYLTPDYVVIGQNQTANTLSPGHHMGNNGHPSIAYNFLNGADRSLNLGRGVDVSNNHGLDDYDAACGGHDETLHGGGGYDKMRVHMDVTGRRLSEALLERGKLEKDYVVATHNQREGVNSPRENVFQRWAMTLIATSPTISNVFKENTSDEEDASSNDDEDIPYGNHSMVQSLGHPGTEQSFGQVSIEHSNNVHFGDKNFYNGPVTIKQVVYANGSATLSSQGKDNVGFDREGEVSVTSEVKRSEPQSAIVKGYLWLQNAPNHRPLQISIFVMILVLFVGVLILVIFLKNYPQEEKRWRGSNEPDNTVNPVDYHQDIVSTGKKLRLVSRIEWLAQPPTDVTTPLHAPVPYAIIHHTATANCSSQAQCVLHVRQIQSFHIESRGWYDIGYNFLVGGDGAAYEGRNWTTEGAHTLGWNNKSIGIAFIGTFEQVKPSKFQLSACQKLLDLGVTLGYLQKNYSLLAVRQLAATQSPGKALYDEIKTWPHWLNRTLKEDA
ncbi:uncharacterized protein [Euwallacea fornicatus]|uniref:uncharacterized protein n=1 Tax=Euwallacea fornicatus TaxID=995702 RepID=UPI00338EAB60